MQNFQLPPKMAHALENIIADKVSGVKIKLNEDGIYTGILNKGIAVLNNDRGNHCQYGKGMHGKQSCQETRSADY